MFNESKTPLKLQNNLTEVRLFAPKLVITLQVYMSYGQIGKLEDIHA